MSVYVDDMQAKVGSMILCHMIADTDDELHAMAARLGVARRWHQAPPQHRSHYDISLSKRALALHYGAMAITWREAAAMTLRRHVTGTLGDSADAEAWHREHIRRKLEESPS